MADINEFTSPDPQETSRALEALKALTSEILTLRTTMRSQAKEIDKMSAAEVAARQEQISKMESLVEAQKVAIKLAEDEALALGASGEATEDLIATVIKQTALANRSQSLIEQELNSRNALNQRLERATREEESRRQRGASLQRINASPTSLRGVANQANADTGQQVAERKKFSEAFEEALNKVFSHPIELLRRISDNVEMMIGVSALRNSEAQTQVPQSTETEQTENANKPIKEFTDLVSFLMGKLSKRIEKVIPEFKVFSDQVRLANSRYDKFVDGLKRGYEKFKELFTLTGMISFLLRVVGVSLTLVGTGLFKFGKKVFDITADFTKNAFRKVSKSLEDFPNSLRLAFMKSVQVINMGVTKAFDGMTKFRDGAFNFAGKMISSAVNFVKGVGSSIAAFSRIAFSFIGTLVAGISRFVFSLVMATAQIIFSAIQFGASMLAAVISFLIPIGGAILTFIGSVLVGAVTFVASLVASTVPFLVAGLAFAATILGAIGSFVLGVVTAVITFIGGLVAALSPILLPALLIVAVIALVLYGLYLAYKKFEWFRNMVNTVGQTISDVFGYLSKFFQAYVFDPIKSVFGYLADFFTTYVFNPIKKIIMGLVDFFSNAYDAFAGSNVGQTLGMKTRAQVAEGQQSSGAEQEKKALSGVVVTPEFAAARMKDHAKDFEAAKKAGDDVQMQIITGRIGVLAQQRDKELAKRRVNTGTDQITVPKSQAGGAGRAQVTVINNAAPVVAGGGGGGPQVPQYVAPARSPNDTLRDLQGANIPRG
jgi:hypothetical protein